MGKYLDALKIMETCQDGTDKTVKTHPDTVSVSFVSSHAEQKRKIFPAAEIALGILEGLVDPAPEQRVENSPFIAPPSPGAYAGPYAQAMEALGAANPTDDAERWQRAKVDAHAFLSRWGESAHLMGWSDLDLFGLHPSHPLVRYDVMGLVWLLRGLTVTAIDQHRACLSNGAGVYRQGWPARRL